MQNHQLWYTRRGKEVRGPFPAPQITRFILLGRIHDTDELSIDQHEWQKVSDVPVLIPQELKTDLSDPEAHKRLLMARMREDERTARDRRDERGKSPGVERRRKSKSDRRTDEEEKMIRHREIKTAIAEAARHHKQNYFLRGVLATLIIVGVIGAAWYFQPWQPQAERVDCNSSPQAWVNWSNCLMEGVQLASADLRGARLRNANLAGSDLRGSQLVGADLAYTNLVGAKLNAARLNQAAMVGTNMRNAVLNEADLTETNLAYAVLQNASLRETNFTNADLVNADLQGADIEGAVWTGAKLDNAIWIDGRACAPGSVGACR